MVSKNLAYNVLKRDKLKCRLCHLEVNPQTKFQIHHIIPKAVGGKDVLDNLTLLCGKCHKEVPHVTNINFKISKRIYDLFLTFLEKEGKRLNEGQRDNLFIFIQKEVVKKRFYDYIEYPKFNKKLNDKSLIKTAERLLKEQPEIFDALLEFEKTGRVPKFEYRGMYGFTFDIHILNNFKTYCEKNGIEISTRLEQHLRKDIEKAN